MQVDWTQKELERLEVVAWHQADNLPLDHDKAQQSVGFAAALQMILGTGDYYTSIVGNISNLREEAAKQPSA